MGVEIISDRSVTEQDVECAHLLWDYEILNEPVERNADAIVLLGSFDLLTAKVAAGLVLSDFSNTLIICGGPTGRDSDLLKGQDKGLPYAEILAREVDKYGVKYELLKETTNTGDEIKTAHNLLMSENKKTGYIIGVHMPSSERRDKAAFQKQWRHLERVVMVSPKMTMEEYQNKGYMGKFTWRRFIEELMGDFQRTFIYSKPKFAFHVPQMQLPEKKVLDSYKQLLEKGFTKSLIKKENGEIYSVEDFDASNLRKNDSA